MPAPFALQLRSEQTTELEHLRDHDPTPYVRERAAAILKVAAGHSLRAVGRSGLLRPHRRETLATWIRRYLAEGGRGCASDRAAGASPRFPPQSEAQARTEVAEVVHRSPRCFGLDHSRWRLRDLGRVIPWLRGFRPGSIHRLLRRLGVRYKRGRHYLHSPDPAYEAKLAAVTAAQLLARTNPGAVVLLYEDEFTYYRRPSLSRAWTGGADAPRVPAGLAHNTRRRVAACLDAGSGRVVAWQRSSFDRATMRHFYQAIAAAYPAAEVIYVAQDNWQVHTHPDVLAALPPSLILLPLPSYAPWTNPVEDLWRSLKAEVLHHHPFGEDWTSLQAAVETWLARWARASPELLHRVGLWPA